MDCPSHANVFEKNNLPPLIPHEQHATERIVITCYSKHNSVFMPTCNWKLCAEII